MVFPIWTTLLDQSMDAGIRTTMAYGAAKLGYIDSLWSSYFSIPQYGDLFCAFPNPNAALAQVAQKMKDAESEGKPLFNNQNLFGGGLDFGGIGGFGSTYFNPFGNLFGGAGVGGNAGAGSTEATSLKSYTNIIDKLIKAGGILSEEQEKMYREALKKSTAAEKLAAVKELFKTIASENADNIKTAVFEDEEVKKALREAGYFAGQNDSDVDLEAGVKQLLTGIGKDYDGGAFTTLASHCRQKGDIIEVISFWNKSKNSDSNRCILRSIAENVRPTHPEGIANFIMALEDYANKNEFKNCPEITKKKEALNDAYNKYLQPVMDNLKSSSDFNSGVKQRLSSALKKVIPAFEDLYAQIRIQQAAKIDDEIYTKYGKEINSAIPDLLDANMIQKETASILKKEGIKNIPSPDKVEKKDKYQRGSSADDNDDSDETVKTKVDTVKEETESNIEELISAGVLEKKGENRYYSSIYKHYYKIGNDGKLHRNDTNDKSVANIDVMLKKADKLNEENEKNKVIPLNESDTDAKSAGKTFRKKLVSNTTSGGYISAERKLKSFFATDDAESIYDFIDGYYLEKWDGTDGPLSYNSRFCAQIASENGWSKEKKLGFIKNIAAQTIKLAQAAGIDPDDDIFDDLNEIVKDGTVDGNWFSNRGARNWWRGNGGLAGIVTSWTVDQFHGYDLMKTARILDSIIIQVKEEYEAKYGDNNLTINNNDKKEENS